MKGIFWIVLAGVVFWWMAISSSSRDTVYRGTRYAVARIAGAIGVEFGRTPPAKAKETSASTGESQEDPNPTAKKRSK